MTQGILSARSLMIGALAAIAAAAFAVNCCMNGGLSVRAGTVEMTMNLTPDQGLNIRFMEAARS